MQCWEQVKVENGILPVLHNRRLQSIYCSFEHLLSVITGSPSFQSKLFQYCRDDAKKVYSGMPAPDSKIIWRLPVRANHCRMSENYQHEMPNITHEKWMFGTDQKLKRMRVAGFRKESETTVGRFQSL